MENFTFEDKKFIAKNQKTTLKNIPKMKIDNNNNNM